MQKQTKLIQNINLLAASDSTGTFGDCRDLVLQLAIVQPLSSDLMSRIDNLLLGDAPAPLERWRALSVEALTLIYENTDTGFYQLAKLAQQDDVAGGVCLTIYVWPCLFIGQCGLVARRRGGWPT